MKNYLKILHNHEHPIRFLAARLLMATGLCRWFIIPQAGYRLRFHPANLSSQVWINPHGRDDSLKFFRDYLKPGDRVIDVGANIGDTVLTSSVAVGASGSVVGIEAHPRTFGFFEDNLRLNRAANVTAINSAVGATSGALRFSDDRRDDMNRVGGGNLEVAVEKLDVLISDSKPVALLKVDVEGYEKFVFQGGAQVLERTECVFFEVSSLHFARFDYTTRDLLELLLTAGFQIFRISGATSLVRTSTDFESSDYENLIALRDEKKFVGRTGWRLGGA